MWPEHGLPFEVGNALVEATLAVHDPETGAALQPGTDANNVWIRPSGKVTPLWPIVINKDGTMTVSANATCRGTVFVASMGVDVRQPGSAGVEVSGYLDEPDVPCDGKKHKFQFILEPPAGKSFVARASRVDLDIYLMHPIEFDPIAQWWWRGNVAVVRR